MHDTWTYVVETIFRTTDHRFSELSQNVLDYCKIFTNRTNIPKSASRDFGRVPMFTPLGAVVDVCNIDVVNCSILLMTPPPKKKKKKKPKKTQKKGGF